MGIINEFINWRRQKKLTEKVTAVKDVYNKEEMEDAILKAIDIVREHPEIAKPFFEKIANDRKLPDSVVVKATEQLIKGAESKEGVSAKAATAGLEVIASELSDKLPDRTLEKIANEAAEATGIKREPELQVAKQIGSTKIRQEKVEEILKRIYNGNLDSKNDLEIIKEIGEVKKIDKEGNYDDLIKKIIAKKMAGAIAKYRNN